MVGVPEMAGHYAEDRWLWAHLSDLAEQDRRAADAVVERLSPVERELLLYAALDSQALLLRDVQRARWWHQQSRERWGVVTVSDLMQWHRDAA